MDALESADPPSPLDRRDPQDLAPRTGALTVALAVLGPLVTWCVVTGLVALFASPEVGPGRCEGIGFGCTLAPRDQVVWSSVIVGLFGIPVVTLFASLVVAALPVWARRTGAWIILGLLAGALAAILRGMSMSA